MKKKSLLLLFTLAIIFGGAGISAQEYRDSVAFGGFNVNLPRADYDFGKLEDGSFPLYPVTQKFVFSPDPLDETTTDNVNVDVTIKYEGYKYDRGTDEILFDSLMHVRVFGNPTNTFGISSLPKEDDAVVENGDTRQINSDELLWMIFESVNNTPPNELYPAVQMSLWKISAWSPADKDFAIYLNGEYIGVGINDGAFGNFKSNIFTDLETRQEVNIAIEEGDTLMLKGIDNTYLRFAGLLMKLEDTEPATSISLSAEGGTAEITELGGTIQILGEVLPATASDKRITWSLDNNDIGATINQASGVVSARPRDAGNGTVTAVATVGSGETAISETIDVTISGQVDILVDSIYVKSWNDSITTNGGTLRMRAEVYPELAANKEVVWSVDDAGTGATIDSTGLLRGGANDNGNGTVIVMATAADGSEVYDTMKVHIDNQETVFVESIEINYDGEFAEIQGDGDSLQLSATILPELVTDNSVTWSLDNNTIGATIDENGLLIASGEDDGNGIVTIVATANDGSGVSSTVQAIVSGQVSDVNAISMQKLSSDVSVYPSMIKDQKLTVKIANENNFIQSITVMNSIGALTEQYNFEGQNASHTTVELKGQSGVYFIRINTTDGSITKRVLLMD